MALDQWSRFIKDNRCSYCVVGEDGMAVSASIVFNSGLILSVQASRRHYCNPRVNYPPEGWTHFEVLAISRITRHDADILGILKYMDEGSLCAQPGILVRIESLDRVARNNGGIAHAVPDEKENE